MLQAMALVALRLVLPRTESHRGLRTMAGRLYPLQGAELPPAVAAEMYEAVAAVSMQFMGHLSEMDLTQVCTSLLRKARRSAVMLVISYVNSTR